MPEINMRRKYHGFVTAFWVGNPPRPDFGTKPNIVGTPRQCLAAADELQRNVGRDAMIGFFMRDPKTGTEYGYREVADAVHEADQEIEWNRMRRR